MNALIKDETMNRKISAVSQRLVVVALLMSLGACASLNGSDGRRTNQPNADAVAESDAHGLTRWWRDWRDPALNELVEQALANNGEIKVAAARLREAQARRDEVDASRFPTLDLLANSVREGRSDARGGGTLSSHRVGLVAAHEIDLWGRLAAQRTTAAHDTRAQGWALATVQWALVAQVVEVHVDLTAVHSKLLAAGEVRDTVLGLVEILQTGTHAGTHAALDLERARADLAATESTIAALHRFRLALLTRRSLLVGAQALDSSHASPSSHDDDLARMASALLPTGSLEDALQRRPDVQEALALFEGRDTALVATRRARWPQVYLSGDVGSDAARVSRLFTAGGMFWSVAQGLALNLFDGGAARARTAQAQARLDAAQASYEHVMTRALLEVREAYAAMHVNRSARDAQERRVASLGRAVSMARSGYEAGALAQIDLLDAQRQNLIARMALVDSQRDLVVGQVAAFKALGAGHNGIGRTPLHGAQQHGERS
jgi:multidrug efflux system outer membrane protein